MPAAEFFYESPDVVAGAVVPQGELIPKDDESYNHTARVCRVGPDNKLYIPLGQPFNVPAKEKLDALRKVGIGGIIRMDRDGKNREVYAIGLRNSGRHGLQPEGQVALVHRQPGRRHGRRHAAGRDESRHQPGQNFGFPWYGGGHIRTDEYKNETPPADVVFPEVEQAAHAADLGMIFYTGKHVPDEISGRDLLGAARLLESHRAGRRAVMVTYVKEDGTPPANPSRSPKAGTTTANISAARSTWRSSPTARSWSPTTWPVRSIASGMTGSNVAIPGMAPDGGPSHLPIVSNS